MSLQGDNGSFAGSNRASSGTSLGFLAPLILCLTEAYFMQEWGPSAELTHYIAAGGDTSPAKLPEA